MAKNRAVVLFSGGLDSRLVVEILQKQGIEVEALNFRLPFGCNCGNDFKNEKFKVIIFDCTKEPLLEEYLNILRHPKHGRGSGINPCIDCKIFMFKKAKEYADKHKIRIIATGEVLGQRPMSQTESSLNRINKEIGFEILRPLSAKLLPEIEIEKLGIVNRDKFFTLNGRQRKEQMQLAEEFGIKYPSPGSGCLLCEKFPGKRILFLLKQNRINEKSIKLCSIGRHFFIDGEWFIVGRNEEESTIIESFKTSVESDIKTPAVFFEKNREIALDLQNAYKIRDAGKFEEFKI